MRSTILVYLTLHVASFWKSPDAKGQSLFNVHLDSVQAGKRGIGLSIREVPDGYLLLTHQSAATGNAPWHFFTRVLDTEGRVTMEMEHAAGDPRYHWIGGVDPLADLPDGTFVVAAAEGNAFNDSTWLYRFSATGELVAHTPLMGFPASDSTLHQFMRVRPLSDGGMLLCGKKKVGATPFRGFLVRLDANGAVIWSRTYLHAEAFTDARELPDGGFALAGYRSNSVDRSCLMRANAVGDLLWVRYTGDRGSGYTSIRLASDGAIVSWSNHRDESGAWNYEQTVLTKRALDATIIWEERSAPGYYRWVSDLEALPDGGFIASGVQGGVGMAVRFNSEGVELWSRSYTILNNVHYIHDIQRASDGGFILAGSAWKYPLVDTLILTREVIWALRTDNLGCVVPGCHTVGVQEVVLDLQAHLRIAPNPASNWMQAELDLPAGAVLKGAPRAVLLNAQGQEVRLWPMLRADGSLLLKEDISNLQSGVYFLHIADADRWLAGGKVVVE